jgi:hypothetical protein
VTGVQTCALPILVNARIKKEELPEEEVTDEGEKIYDTAKT